MTSIMNTTIINTKPVSKSTTTPKTISRNPNFTKINAMSSYNQYWVHYVLPDQYYEYSQFPQPLDTPRGPTFPNLSFVSSLNLNLQNIVVLYPQITQHTVSPFLFIM